MIAKESESGTEVMEHHVPGSKTGLWLQEATAAEQGAGAWQGDQAGSS